MKFIANAIYDILNVGKKIYDFLGIKFMQKTKINLKEFKYILPDVF